MTALSGERDTKRRTGQLLSLPMATATKIYEGSIVCLNAGGYATKGAVAATLRAAGRALSTVDNPGANGALNIDVERGIFKFENSAGADEITLADYGKDVYILDDQTVALTSGGAARSIAGKVRGVEADGVWVEI
jgi:hypothetical protein